MPDVIVMTFVKDSIPLTTVATVEAIFGSVYFGIGRGLGGLIGGFTIEALGNVTSFRIFGSVSVASVGIYSLVMTVEAFRKKREYTIHPV